MGANKYIIAGWALYLASIIMPWSVKPFGGWLFGWFWQIADFFPFFRFVTLEQFGWLELSGTMAILAGMAMWVSPLFLYLLNKGVIETSGLVPLLSFILALASGAIKIVFIAEHDPPLGILYVLGNLLWIASFWILYIGFKKQVPPQ
ncbi:hypothetical protein [Kaarinaea lacus]